MQVCLAPKRMLSGLPYHLCCLLGGTNFKEEYKCLHYIHSLIHSYILTNKHIKLDHIKLLIFGHFGPTKMAVSYGLMQ